MYKMSEIIYSFNREKSKNYSLVLLNNKMPLIFIHKSKKSSFPCHNATKSQ